MPVLSGIDIQMVRKPSKPPLPQDDIGRVGRILIRLGAIGGSRPPYGVYRPATTTSVAARAPDCAAPSIDWYQMVAVSTPAQ
jgi:hypothetical protein